MEARVIQARVRARREKGFSMLELMIVIFIIGLVSAVVIVAVGKVYDSSVFREEGRKIYQVLKRGRNISVLNRTVTVFRADAGTGSYWLEKNGQLLEKSYTLPGNMKIDEAKIVFYPKGDSSGGKLELKGPSERRTIIEIDPVTGDAKFKGL